MKICNVFALRKGSPKRRCEPLRAGYAILAADPATTQADAFDASAEMIGGRRATAKTVPTCELIEGVDGEKSRFVDGRASAPAPDRRRNEIAQG
jgi:hypothetical protein